MTIMKYFLLVFDTIKNELIELKEFDTNAVLATSAYDAKEQEFVDTPSVNIVLVGSDSIETVKVTHSTYFPDTARSLIENAFSVAG